MFDMLSDLFSSLINGVIWFVTALPLAMLELLPVPDWMTDSTFALPDGVMWFASAFELPAGLVILSGAWLIRFIIRRIPIIG
jgi:hypothetical protein